jgi:uncharacterized protein YbbK (DUF523 family)
VTARTDWRSPDLEIKVGFSACLLGHEVRYDGGHERDTFVADTLGRFVTWVPVGREVEVGLGTPRELIRWRVPAAASPPRMPLARRLSTGLD